MLVERSVNRETRGLPRPASCIGMVHVEFEMRNECSLSSQQRSHPQSKRVQMTMTSSSSNAVNAVTEQSTSAASWQMSLGAQVEPVGVRFRVWAPKRARVDVVLESDGRSFPLLKDEAGYFSGHVPIAAAGMRYRYRLDNGEAFPDPC